MRVFIERRKKTHCSRMNMRNIFGIIIILIPHMTSACDHEGEACEFGRASFQWRCPAGDINVAKVFWGWDSVSNGACSTDPNQGSVDCPGDGSKAAKAVKTWCDAHVEGDGVCMIYASKETLEHDPCPGKAKQLRVCVDCKSTIDEFRMEFSMNPVNASRYEDVTSVVKEKVESVVAQFTGDFSVELKSVKSSQSPSYIAVELEMSGESDLSAMTALCEVLNVTMLGMGVPFTGNAIKVYGHEASYMAGVCSLYYAFNACINGGRCVGISGSPTCECEHPFTGRYCENVGCDSLNPTKIVPPAGPNMDMSLCDTLPDVKRKVDAVLAKCTSYNGRFMLQYVWGLFQNKCAPQ